ncbi:class I SAM-dependent methyltransferase [Caulobacter flavus]|uniref:Class I SAM-dependent methyltransferase n=1 Tax=Caulobacter flavus TaxID=1679497 RepID=A0A2N5CR60_9CAUL|nr:class I SAM-dependent methyltransferase [Caulobacter flavus]AYV46123.1 class I SAM-dependent methyltransferase [Caulobacter flavus]PLR11223.1 class I SAM-dependent methyltransferase [Caulobacter flavus]
MIATVLAGYEADGAGLVERFEAIDPAALYAPVQDFIPAVSARIADIGAGTGRDAAWLAGLGHAVVAVEPVAALREAGRALRPDLVWVDDRLPALSGLRGELFDRVLLSGVWQHLDDAARAIAMPALASLLAPGGILVMSLRHGPGAPSRPVWPVDVEVTVTLAEAAGLRLVHCVEADSVQAGNRAAGVTWTWVAFASASPPP